MRTDADVTDFFCGMGGSSTGLVEAGFTVKLAANHWDKAVETHSANHPNTEHLCAAIESIDLRYLPRTRFLWASPICTEVSPAGGRRKKGSQLDLFEDHGHVASAAFERTRVTFWEVIRATELFRYDAVMIENVTEAAEWELFPYWLAAMEALGYESTFMSASSAHLYSDNSAPAPQWRDRIYIAFTKVGMRKPDLEPRPWAWCEKCSDNVQAVQWWKNADSRRIGKYRSQYIYVCPVGNHGQVEPYVMPAAAAIDWTDLGTKIGERPRPLAAKTMARIRQGAELVASGKFSFSMAHGGRALPLDIDGEPMKTWTTGDTEALALAPWVMGVNHDSARHFDPHANAMPTETVKQGRALVSPPDASLLLAAAGNTYDAASGKPGGYLRAWPASGDAMRTQTTTGQLGLAVPDEAFVATLRQHSTPESVADPLRTVTGGGFHHSLVVPFRRGARPYPAGNGPLSTTATHSQHGVMHGEGQLDLSEWRFRMLRARESANAQRFPRDYIIHGNQGEQQMQAGNAVSVNAARWIGERVMAVAA